MLRAAVVCVGLMVLPPARAAPPGMPELWFDPLDDTYRGYLKKSVSPDYMQLFRPGAPWGQTLAALKVFVIGAAVPLDKTDAELRQIIGSLRQHHVALVLQTQGLEQPRDCGSGLEAYRPLSEVMTAVQRIRAAGGQLAAISLDEPLWYAHSYHGRNACQTPIAEVAQQLTFRLKMVRAVFPNLVFGDIEPMNAFEASELRPTLEAFYDAYQAAAGEPFAYLQSDQNWGRPWQAALLDAAAFARSKGLRFGVIYTGNGTTDSNQQWNDQALARARAIMALLPPDQSVFESWMVHPEHVLPETDSGSFTGLLRSYLGTERRLLAGQR